MRKYIVSLPALMLFCLSSYGQQKSAGIQPATADNTLPLIEGEHNYVYTRTMLDKSGAQYIDDIQYYDGLGREYEHVGRKLASLQEYDAMGRKEKVWHPVSTNASFMPADLCKTSAYWDYNDNRAFTQTKYEASPLGRVIEQYGAGDAWQNHPVRTEYLTNGSEASLRCSLYSINEDNSLVRLSDYLPGELKVTKMTDEDNNATYTFVDKLEHEILVRKQNGDEWLDTYFVYDSQDRLCYILPPMINDNISLDNLNLYAFQYEYDEYGRCIRMKHPGCAGMQYVYDSMDRLVYSQDGNQARYSKWNFQFSDKLGRVIMSGIGDASTADCPNISNLQVYVERTGRGDGAMNTGYYIYNSLGISKYHLKKVNFYDDYNFIHLEHASPFLFSFHFMDFPEYLRPHRDDFSDLYQFATGLQTGQRIYLADSEEHLTSVFYYDKQGRLLQKRTTNILGGYDVDFYSYTFSGMVDRHVLVHTTAKTNELLTECYEYVYDDEGKLWKVNYRLNNDLPVLLSINEYDRLQRLSGVGLNDAKTHLQYDYNVRNQMTGITGAHFQQNLHYTDGFGLPCYTGNISSMTWKAGNEPTVHGYKFAYDAIGRLQDAVYGETDSLNVNIGRFTEQITGYDKNGNMTGVKRYGLTGTDSYGLVNDFAFTLNGNQLQSLNGNMCYSYDGNGNQTKDLSKEVNGVKYNFLNLPSLVKFTDGSNIAYTYGGDGVKHRVVHTVDSVSTVKNYCGNVIYEDSVPKLLLIETGYITLADKVFHFYLKDHQGNVRVVLNQSDTVEEVNHYYPFGGLFASSGDVQPYKYSGKELDTTKGLNLYDYGARHYDAGVGRFTTFDPLAENDCSVSPYVYCGNNSVNMIDPTGAIFSPIYHINGKLLGTDEEGFEGQSIIMNESNFKQGMSHEEALNYSLGYEGLINDMARSNYVTSYTGLKDRPDYDGFVTIDEGVEWAKLHPNALDSPTPDNSLYVNTGLLDFGDLTVEKIGIRNTGKVYPINLFNKTNTLNSIINNKLRATIYALGAVDIILQNPVLRTIRVVNNDATDYDWNGGGSFIRNTAIQIEKKRTGLKESMGFKTYYYGVGYLNK